MSLGGDHAWWRSSPFPLPPKCRYDWEQRSISLSVFLARTFLCVGSCGNSCRAGGRMSAKQASERGRCVLARQVLSSSMELRARESSIYGSTGSDRDGGPSSSPRRGSLMDVSDGAAAAPSKKLSALDITLHERLGSGSFGTVYSASTPQHGDVAVKVLPWSSSQCR